MTWFQIVGWKVYGVAVISILCGMFALAHQHWVDGLKGIVFGLALITLRDTMGKILRAADDNRKALNNVRASIETLLAKQLNKSQSRG